MSEQSSQAIETSRRRRNWRGWSWLALLVGVSTVIGLTRLGSSRTSRSWEATEPLFEVQKGPLSITVDVPGTLRSDQAITLKNEVEGRTAIISLVEEGTRVQEGDLLVELDASELQDREIDQEIKVQTSQASVVQSREALQVTKQQAENDIATAELAYNFAQQDVRKYLEGDYPQQLGEAREQIKLAEGEFERAKDKLEWSHKLAKEGYITQAELKSDELEEQRAAIKLEQSKRSLKVLEDFTHQRELATLRSEVDSKRVQLSLTRYKANSSITEAESSMKSKEISHEREEERLEKIKEQIAKSKIYAPVDGMVVYVVNDRGDQEPLREGVEVLERQSLIRLPTTGKMVADVKVHESQLKKVKVGQVARITTDALPGQEFWGHVRKIAVLPDAQSRWMNPDLKVYNTEVEIADDIDVSGMRPGMSCNVSMVVQNFDDALYIPIQSVVQVGGRPTVYVPGEEGPLPRTVKVGLDNNRMVVVTDGLRQGEKVLLSPPLPEAEADSEVQMRRPPQESPVRPPPSREAPAASEEGQPQGTSSGEQRRQRPAQGEGREPRTGKPPSVRPSASSGERGA